MTPLLLGFAAFVAGQNADPVKSSGPWVAKYEDRICVLSRAYGADPHKLQLALRPMPGDDQIEIVLITPNTGKPFSRAGKARLELLPGGRSAEPYYRDYTIADGAKRMVRFFVKRAEIGDLASSTSLRISLDGETRHLALTRAAEALKAIEGCEDEMLRGWGIDPEAMRNIATPPSPLTPENSWIQGSDYPLHETTRYRAGAVRLRWTVDTSGKISDCAIIQSSGHASLDALSCRLITERGRYKPAIDRQGSPAISFRTKTVQWSLIGPTLKDLNGN